MFSSMCRKLADILEDLREVKYSHVRSKDVSLLDTRDVLGGPGGLD